MVLKESRFFTILSFITVGIILSLSFVIAASCWTYTSSSTCTLSNGCLWRNDTWGSWCEELNCWSLANQSSCTTTTIAGKNCTWTNGTASSWCTTASCWAFSATNQTQCENNYFNKSCSWSGQCYQVTGGLNVGCWGIATEAACKNTTGCGWGQCIEKGCNIYTSQSACNSGLDWRGINCTWGASGSYCRENNCWDSTLYSNKTACESAQGINCEWKWGSCQQKGCSSFDYTNQKACVNNTLGESCKWQSINNL